MAVAFQVRKTDDVIFGILSAPTIPDDTATSAADYYYRETIPARALEVSNAGFWWGNSTDFPRWLWDDVGEDAVEQEDTRRRAAFTTVGGVVFSGRQDRLVGQADLTFRVVVLEGTSGDTIDTTISGDYQFMLADGTWVAVTIASGIGLLTLVADKPKNIYVPDQGNLNFVNNLEVRVRADATI